MTYRRHRNQEFPRFFKLIDATYKTPQFTGSLAELEPDIRP
jgi:hypothetical protein